jgi:hypothetical protein
MVARVPITPMWLLRVAAAAACAPGLITPRDGDRQLAREDRERERGSGVTRDDEWFGFAFSGAEADSRGL